jgi:hypothetical protein
MATTATFSAIVHAHEQSYAAKKVFAESATADQALLESMILSRHAVEHAVLTAANMGLSEAVIHEFKGGDTFGRCNQLFLVLGAEDEHRRQELESFGFVGLLPRLREKLRPFRLRHEWDKETNGNTLIMSW